MYVCTSSTNVHMDTIIHCTAQPPKCVLYSLHVANTTTSVYLYVHSTHNLHEHSATFNSTTENHPESEVVGYTTPHFLLVYMVVNCLHTTYMYTHYCQP